MQRITDVSCKCSKCEWSGTVGDCEPDVDGDGSLGCPNCLTIIPVTVPTPSFEKKSRLEMTEMTTDELWQAIDGLMAYDVGSTDSGIHDESLRKRVIDTLNKMTNDERKQYLAKMARDYLLSDEAIDQGYGIEDVHELCEWIDNLL